MAANTSPIFINKANIGYAEGIGTGTANTAVDGTGTLTTNIWTIFTPGTNGSFLQSIRIKALGTNSSASVIRVFLNNSGAGANSSAANNTFITEQTIPATTGSNTAALPDFDIPINRAIPSGWLVNVTTATAGGAGWTITAFGGDY